MCNAHEEAGMQSNGQCMHMTRLRDASTAAILIVAFGPPLGCIVGWCVFSAINAGHHIFSGMTIQELMLHPATAKWFRAFPKYLVWAYEFLPAVILAGMYAFWRILRTGWVTLAETLLLAFLVALLSPFSWFIRRLDELTDTRFLGFMLSLSASFVLPAIVSALLLRWIMLRLKILIPPPRQG